MTKNLKNSEIILGEILKLHSFLDRKTIKEATETQLHRWIDKLQEPRLFNYLNARKLEEMEAKRKQREYLRRNL